MSKRGCKLLKKSCLVLPVLLVGLSGPAFSQSMPDWKSYTQTHDVKDIVSSLEVAAWIGKKIDLTQMGVANGVASLDSFGSLVAPINSLGLRWPFASGISYNDVTSAYNNAANNERIIFPCGSIWPAYGNTPRPTGPHTNGKHVEWDLSCNGNWSDNEGWGAQVDNPVGDGDLTLSSINGGRWFMRQDTAQDNGQPVVNIVGVFNNQATCFWSGGVSCNEPVFSPLLRLNPERLLHLRLVCSQ